MFAGDSLRETQLVHTFANPISPELGYTDSCQLFFQDTYVTSLLQEFPFLLAYLSIVIFFPSWKVGDTRKCSVSGRYIYSTS